MDKNTRPKEGNEKPESNYEMVEKDHILQHKPDSKQKVTN